VVAPVKSIERRGNSVTVTKVCCICGKDAIVRDIPLRAYQAWNEGKGMLIQNALPMLSDGDRGILISGTHDKCFDDSFPEDGSDTDFWEFIDFASGAGGHE
jgi:hypothetical protein